MRDLEIDFSQWLACHLRKFLVRDPLEKGFTCVGSGYIPTTNCNFDAKNSLASTMAGSSVASHAILIEVLKSSKAKTCSHNFDLLDFTSFKRGFG